MQITCWGSRGSIPVSGPEYLRYGGDTTCLEVRTEDARTVVIDAGTGIRRLGLGLVSAGVSSLSLLFTHAHWDHLLGLPFFAPLYRAGTTIDLYGAATAQTSVRDMVSHAIRPPYFPVKVTDLAATLRYQGTCTERFALGSVEVEPFPLSHPNGGLGYKLVEAGKRFVFLTDNELGHHHDGGLSRDDYVALCAGADLLLHDAEYTPEEAVAKRGWGHSSYVDAVELALDAGVSALGLFHHNHERSDDEVDRIVERSRELVRERGGTLRCFAAAQAMALPL